MQEVNTLYASLSKVLTASIKRRSSILSTSSNLSNQSTQSRHYVKITSIVSQREKRLSLQSVPSYGYDGESGSAPYDRNRNPPSTSSSASTTMRGNNISNNNNDPQQPGAEEEGEEEGCTDTNRGSKGTKSSRVVDQLATTDSPIIEAQHKNSRVSIGQGVTPTTKDSVLATDFPAPANPHRSASVSTGTDIDAEIRTRVQQKYKVVLRSRSVESSTHHHSRSVDSYSDTQPRSSKKRPKSAVIIQPSADGETALVSGVELKTHHGSSSSSNDGGPGKKSRRRSMEINLASLAKTGLLSPSNIIGSPAGTPPTLSRVARSPGRRKRCGSLSVLQAGDRSSIASIDSLDPRAMIAGRLEQNSHEFNTSIRSNASARSAVSIKSEPGVVSSSMMNGSPMRNGHHLGVGSELQAGKRSASMEVLDKTEG